MTFEVLQGDCREVMKTLANNSVGSVVTDPPYELGFMGKAWDRSGIAYQVEVWAECLRLLKPGGHLLAFGGSRTYHRLACAIEDAGFEIRDQIMWLYGQGFPKSLDVSKAIDALAGAEREVVGRNPNTAGRTARNSSGLMNQVQGVVDMGNPFLTTAATDAAKQWNGWGTALKPSHEPIIWARKPLTLVPLESKLIAESQSLIGGLLCQLLFNVNSVEASSKLNLSVSGEASASALMLAVALHGQLSGEWCERMATFNSPGTVSTCLSIASLWNGILDALLNHGSRFTTATIIGLTTALETLNSCLSEIMPDSIIRAAFHPVGDLLSVKGAEPSSSGEQESLTLTQKHIAHALASLRQVFISAKGAEQSFEAAARAVNSALRTAITTLEESLLPETRPAHEPIVLARKPLIGTVAENVLQHGTGGLNIDGCRIETAEIIAPFGSPRQSVGGLLNTTDAPRETFEQNALGRWPSNVIHDGSDEVLAGFPESDGQQGDLNATGRARPSSGRFGDMAAPLPHIARNDSGSAARFFYCAKASKEDREEGLESLPLRSAGEVTDRQDGSDGLNSPRAGAGRTNGSRNVHPTVKPTSLMRYLVRLVTPPNGTVLDPFCGSGSTGRAAILEQLNFIGIELNAEYCELAEKRIEAVTRQGMLMFA